jgi:hypothetical protein
MALEKFTLGTLAEMDNGRIKTAFEQALDRCRFDCEDRPSVEGARKIVLTVTMEPIPTDAGELDTVDVSFDLQERLPKRGSKTYNMQAVAGGLLFNELSPDEVRQKTLDMQPAPKPKQPESAPPKGKEVKTNAG